MKNAEAEFELRMNSSLSAKKDHALGKSAMKIVPEHQSRTLTTIKTGVQPSQEMRLERSKDTKQEHVASIDALREKEKCPRHVEDS